jgi:hypothetical protein
MKQYVFSNEVVQVGISEIDEQIRNYYPRTNISLISGTGKFINDEIIYQGANLASATVQGLVYDFTPNSAISVYRTKGTFIAGQVKGNTSGAIWSSNTGDDLTPYNTVFEDIVDNKRIQTEGDSIIDFTEVNPFGEP